ncbi:helix-turn-helix transcriptional regulator [Cyanobacteria bacterium FACHB-DQ100]|uniref:helix-turn-helix transcriptional regulator n=1 Tax=Leptolyngbya sp. DQ-M1 TaxID=2933920 RepID=UPI0019C7C9EA|nr:helix-turn-helix transcriptional regulator [Cyanobacteria bacterium FACHB-DQ100]
MHHLTQRDLRGMLRFCQSLLAPCQLEEFPQQVLFHLAEIVPSEISAYAEVNLHIGSVSTLASSFDNGLQLGHSQIEATAQRHFHENPLVTHYLQTQDGGAYKISDFLSESELHRLSGMYEQFLQPLGMEDQFAIALAVPNITAIPRHLKQPKLIVLNLHRSDRSFSERDRTVLNLLHPHLLQAYQNATALTQTQQELTAFRQTIEQLGLIGLNEGGQVRWLTDRAWLLLKQYDLTSSHQKGRLSDTLERWIKHQIALRATTSDILQPCLPLYIEQSDRRLIVRLVDQTITPPDGLAKSALLDEPYLLTVDEEALLPFSAQSLEALGLTQREAEVLYWLIQDKQNSEIARLLGIQAGTLKKHIEHVYTKLGVQTRTAAVLQALQRLGLLH